MVESLAEYGHIGFILLIMFWMLIVRFTLWTLDRLFPRIERNCDDDR